MTSIPAARFEAEVVGAGDSNEMKESNESNEKKEEVEADRRMAWVVRGRASAIAP